MAPGLAITIRAAIETGDWAGLDLRADTVLRTSNETGRQRIEGAPAITAHLSKAGPGEVGVWDAREFPDGIALTFEWTGASGTDRRRWYLRTAEDGSISEIWIVAARPQPTDESEPDRPPRALLERLGATHVEPLVHGGNSGAALLRARGEADFVLKRVTAGADWLARATNDNGRTAQLWEAGAFAAMPPAIDHGIVDVERDGAAAWVAMRDVAAKLLPDDALLSRAESRQILNASAALHETFRDRVPEGAAALRDRLGMSSPVIAEAERSNPDLLPKQFEHAWEAFADVVPDDVAMPVLALAGDASPLADALVLANGASTLIHGDLRDDNLGLDGDTLVLIDWDLATAGTPTAEFAWYLAQDAWRIDATHDELEQDHRAAHHEELAEHEVELGMLSGLVQYGWILAHSARVHPDPVETAWGREELAWWVPRVREALGRLGGAPTAAAPR